MLGHQLMLGLQDRHEVRVTLHGPMAAYSQYGMFHGGNSFANVNVRDTERILEVMGAFRPEAVINCVGIVKQRSEAKESIPSLEINSVLPHRLRLICASAGARLVQLSSDCVFNGRRGLYRQTDAGDAEDLYGLSKYLGEVAEAPAITIRLSTIGLELGRKHGLVEWFLAQRGTIRGFTRAIYTGVITAELPRIVEHVLEREPDLHGLWQVASEPISKYDLLCRLSVLLDRSDVTIFPDDQFHCDRSLDGAAFAERTGYRVPDWDQMLQKLTTQIQERGTLYEAT